MSSRAVKQPNGLYARFSTIVDDFTHYNATREELWTIFRDEGGIDCANGKMERADKDLSVDGSTGRFEEALKTIEICHGKDIAVKRRKDLS